MALKPRPKPARFVFTVGMVLAMALTMTWAAAPSSSYPVYQPQFLLVY